MSRLSKMFFYVLSVITVSFIAGAFLGVAIYTFNNFSSFEWSTFFREAGYRGGRLSQFFGLIAFSIFFMQYALFAAPLSDEEELSTLLLGIFGTFMFFEYQMPPSTFEYIVHRVVAFPSAIAIMYLVWRRMKNKPMDEPIGIIVKGNRNGLVALEWSQLVATDDTLASENAKGRFQLYLGFVLTCTVVGWATGGLENMIFWAIIAGWLGAFALRGAGSLKMQGQALASVPHVKTETERREEMIPVTKREDCQAYLEIADNQVWFCIARGDKTKGPLELAERVPWESFSNFEEGSHKQWFRGRGSVSDLADWGVIVAQSSVGRVVRVAESVHEQAWLVELLVTLQNTFIAPRDAMIRQMRETAQANARAQSKASAPGTSEQYDVPNKQF